MKFLHLLKQRGLSETDAAARHPAKSRQLKPMMQALIYRAGPRWR